MNMMTLNIFIHPPLVSLSIMPIILRTTPNMNSRKTIPMTAMKKPNISIILLTLF